jgi:hypothetical protein
MYYNIPVPTSCAVVILKGWKSDLFFNFGQFPCAWIRIRILKYGSGSRRAKSIPTHADLDPKHCLIIVRVSSLCCAGNDVQLVRELDREQPLPPGRRPRGLCGAHHRARPSALRQSAPWAQRHPCCCQQSRIPGLVWFLQSRFICSKLSTVLSASQSAPRTLGYPRCRQQSWIPGLVWFLQSYVYMFHTEHGRVRFDTALLGPRDILAAVNRLGFQVWFGFYSHVPTLSTVVSASTDRSSDPAISKLSGITFSLVSTVTVPTHKDETRSPLSATVTAPGLGLVEVELMAGSM